MTESCGLLHGNDRIGPRDDAGCVLPINHEGPHEFVSPDGSHWRWETDFECECEWCRKCEGDYCTSYWPKPDGAKP